MYVRTNNLQNKTKLETFFEMHRDILELFQLSQHKVNAHRNDEPVSICFLPILNRRCKRP